LILFFGTLGIDAVDHHKDMKESILGRLIFGEENNLCPEGMSFIDSAERDFCIDRYEASPASDCPYEDPGSQIESSANINYQGCVPVSKKDKVPWRYVSQSQAAELCARAGKRLPTMKEWTKASRGFFDKNGDWGSEDCHLAGNWGQQPGLSGTGGNCVSPDGVYDMIGNVWEWIDGDIKEGRWQDIEMPEEGYISEVDASGVPIATGNKGSEAHKNDHLWIKKQGVRGIARGGYWMSQEKGGKYSFYMTVPISYTGNGIGFRCVK
jgi:formylglycine-generating enzyme required for sulfatase activity